MRAYWVPGVNNLKKFGRWAFAEFTAVYEIESAFNDLLASFGPPLGKADLTSAPVISNAGSAGDLKPRGLG
jgi:hypothetical protein